MDKLSRRLHQYSPRRLPGALGTGLANYRKTRKLRLTEAAYLAGLVDGEGTVTLTRKHKNDYRQLAITISSTERYLLESVLEMTEAGKITRKRTISPDHSASFTFAIYNRQALSLLEQIKPFLRTYKKKRAEMILRDYLRLTPRNGKYSTEQMVEKRKFEQELLAVKANSE